MHSRNRARRSSCPQQAYNLVGSSHPRLISVSKVRPSFQSEEEPLLQQYRMDLPTAESQLVSRAAELSLARRTWAPIFRTRTHSCVWPQRAPPPFYSQGESQWDGLGPNTRAGLWSHSCNACPPSRTSRDWPTPEAASRQGSSQKGCVQGFPG